MTDTPDKGPALGDERLVFSLANSEDDRREHGCPTLRVLHRIDDSEGMETIEHLDRRSAMKLMHSLQQHVARLDAASRQYDGRVQRLRSRGYHFDQTDDGHRLYHNDAVIEEGLASKEDALIKAEMHLMPKSKEPT